MYNYVRMKYGCSFSLLLLMITVFFMSVFIRGTDYIDYYCIYFYNFITFIKCEV